jgi:hypothetical protein
LDVDPLTKLTILLQEKAPADQDVPRGFEWKVKRDVPEDAVCSFKQSSRVIALILLASLIIMGQELGGTVRPLAKETD